MSLFLTLFSMIFFTFLVALSFPSVVLVHYENVCLQVVLELIVCVLEHAVSYELYTLAFNHSFTHGTRGF